MIFFKKNTVLFFITNLIVISSFSQNIKKGDAYLYARKIVDTMASESMHGRGYVNNGEKIAANYLKTEFQKLGLSKFTSDYYQKFAFPINTIPGAMSIKIDGKELVPGKDFIVNSNFKSTNTSFNLFHFTYADYAKSKKDAKATIKKMKDCFVVNDSTAAKRENKYIPCKAEGKGIINKEKKLTWSMGQDPNDCLEILMMNDVDVANAKQIQINIENKFIPDYQSQNVIGFIRGSEYTDSFIVFTAHYDHLGQMGKDVYFPGANDNASGCAMLLNLARHYSKPENKPKYSIAFIAFAGEEVGILGSRYYTENPLFPLEKIKFLFNMDIMGTGEEGITVVNGTVFKKEFEKLQQINAENKFIADVKIRGKAAISDHYFFTEKGVKSFFIYTMGGIKAYHDIYDRPETLPLNEFENLFQLIVKFGEFLQN